MTDFEKELNAMFNKTFQAINKIEEKSISKIGEKKITNSEVHLIEAVGKDKNNGRTVSEIAQDLSITNASATIAINKIISKGYANKIKNQEDGRSVKVTLTREGRRVYLAHSYLHHNLINKISKEMTDEEKKVLLSSVTKINEFFEKTIKGMEE